MNLNGVSIIGYNVGLNPNTNSGHIKSLINADHVTGNLGQPNPALDTSWKSADELLRGSSFLDRVYMEVE